MVMRYLFDEPQHDPGGRVRRPLGLGVKGSALFAGDRKQYRYVLRRIWEP